LIFSVKAFTRPLGLRQFALDIFGDVEIFIEVGRSRVGFNRLDLFDF
jgi:hypothetical protein